MTTKAIDDIISSLKGTSLRVFVYAVKEGDDIGVRESQRRLGLKTASHAQYHLQRLEQLGLLEKNKNNKYYLPEKYANLRSIKLGILTEVYVIRGWLVPSLGIFGGFLGMSAIITILFYFLLFPLSSLIYGSIALVIGAIYASIRAYQIVKSFKQSE